MKCKCIHSDVCVHRKELQSAFKGIVELQIGGRHPKYTMIDNLVQTVCRYRTPRVEEHSTQQSHVKTNAST